jgi:hypothetical protein
MLKTATPQYGEQNVSACIWVFVQTGAPASGATSSCSAQFSGALQTEVNGAVASGAWQEFVVGASFANSATIPTMEQYFQAIQYSYQLQAIQPGGPSGHECDVTGCN